MGTPFKPAGEGWLGVASTWLILTRLHLLRLWQPLDVQCRHASETMDASNWQPFRPHCLLSVTYPSKPSHTHLSKPSHPFSCWVVICLSSHLPGPGSKPAPSFSKSWLLTGSCLFPCGLKFLSGKEQEETRSGFSGPLALLKCMHGHQIALIQPSTCGKISSAQTHFLFPTSSVLLVYPLAVWQIYCSVLG